LGRRLYESFTMVTLRTLFDPFIVYIDLKLAVSYSFFLVDKMFKLRSKDPSTNSYLKISLQVYNRIYQKGLTQQQISSSCPQVLTGLLVLSVFKPVDILEIKVSWMGDCLEMVYAEGRNDALFDDTVQYSKQIDKHSLVNESIHFHESVLPPGIYKYDFDFVVDPFLPESIKSRYITNKYCVKVDVSHVTGSATKQVTSKTDVQLIRSVPEDFSPFADPLIASGNWRNKLIYEFDLQTKMAFQMSTYCATVGVYPVATFHDFRVYSMSIILLQQILFDIVDQESGNLTEPPKKHVEVQKIMLHHKELTMEDMYSFLTPEGYLKLTANFIIPTITTGNEDSHTSKSNKVVYPSFNHDKKSGFSISHTIKAIFEVGELKASDRKSFEDITSRRYSQQSGDSPRRLSEETLVPIITESNPNPNENSSEINGCDTLSSRTASETTLTSLSTKSTVNPYVVPSYRAFHDSRQDASKYKKVELSYSSPISILSPNTSDTISQPKYTPVDPSNFLFENSFNLTQKCLKHFKTKTKVNQIVPPMYTEYSI
jgi:hypothetical protein